MSEMAHLFASWLTSSPSVWICMSALALSTTTCLPRFCAMKGHFSSCVPRKNERTIGTTCLLTTGLLAYTTSRSPSSSSACGARMNAEPIRRPLHTDTCWLFSSKGLPSIVIFSS